MLGAGHVRQLSWYQPSDRCCCSPHRTACTAPPVPHRLYRPAVPHRLYRRHVLLGPRHRPAAARLLRRRGARGQGALQALPAAGVRYASGGHAPSSDSSPTPPRPPPPLTHRIPHRTVPHRVPRRAWA